MLNDLPTQATPQETTEQSVSNNQDDNHMESSDVGSLFDNSQEYADCVRMEAEDQGQQPSLDDEHQYSLHDRSLQGNTPIRFGTNLTVEEEVM